MKDKINNYIKKTEEFVESYITRDNKIQDLEALMTMSKESLDEEIISNSARYAWLGIMSEIAKADELLAERNYNRTCDIVATGYRTGQLNLPIGYDTGGKKLSDKSVESLVNINEEVDRLCKVFIEARRKAGILAKIVKAIERKGDLIRTYASNLRGEMGSDFDLKEKKQYYDTLNDN